MANWLEPKEKIFRHDQYLKWVQNGSPIPTLHVEWEPSGLELGRFLHMSKYPTVHAIPINRLIKDYGATYFHAVLARFIALANEPDLMCAQLEARLCSVRMPFVSVTDCPTYLTFSFLFRFFSLFCL